MQSAFRTGLGVRREHIDVAGIGVSFGKPADRLLRDQYTSEWFYRLRLTRFLASAPWPAIDRQTRARSE